MMRINFSFFFYLFCSFLFIIIQTSVIPTSSLGKFTPDLNLIIIIWLAIRPEIPNLFILAFLSGFLMDIFSAQNLGFHTVTRFIVFLGLWSSLHSFNYNPKKLSSLLVGFFAGTLLLYLLLLLLFLSKQVGQIEFFSVELALYQAIINTVIGVPIVVLLRKLDGVTEA